MAAMLLLLIISISFQLTPAIGRAAASNSFVMPHDAATAEAMPLLLRLRWDAWIWWGDEYSLHYGIGRPNARLPLL